MSVISGAAFAQSSVTLYGVVDAGIIHTAAGTKADVGLNGGPRLGVKGSEDLGGGLSSTFMIESAVNMAGGDTTIPAGNVLNGNRGATVGLKGSFGAVDVGTKNLSVGFYTTAAVETTGMANYGVTGIAGGSRNANPAVQYTSPTMNGLTVRASMVMANNNGGDAQNAIGAVYTMGGLTLAGARTDNGAAAKGTDKFYGAKYNFGPAAVHVTSTDNNGTKATTYGLTAPMGAASLFIDYKNPKTGADTTIIGGTYNLSKSTFLYGAVNNTDGADTTTLVGIRKNF